MDPDGTIYFVINLILSFVLCLYIAAESQRDTDKDFVIGLSDNLISAGLLFLLNIWVLTFAVMPRFVFNVQLLLWALFVFIATVLPFCLGLALQEKLQKFIKAMGIFMVLPNYTLTFLVSLPVKAVFHLGKLDTHTHITQQDVMDFMEDASEDIIDDEQKEMIENIFQLDEMTAGDIMTHRTEVFAVSEDEICASVIQKAKEEGFSRIPVYGSTIDTISGILYAKDLLNVVGDEEKLNMPIKGLVRKAMFVPQSCAANELLLQFKRKRTQMAVVVDEYGGTSGIVTMEDVLEEIVGNIQDEYDQEEELFVKNSDTSLTCMAYMDLDEALEQLGVTPPDALDQEDFDTVGGLIIDRLERIPTPEENACVEYEGLNFKVLEVADRRIVKVFVSMVPTSSPENV